MGPAGVAMAPDDADWSQAETWRVSIPAGVPHDGCEAYLIVDYVGDAARYLSPLPRNIRLRQKIRGECVRLLRTLHASGEYDRIIVVGHSLGSVIAYDAITHLWQEFNEELPGLEDVLDDPQALPDIHLQHFQQAAIANIDEWQVLTTEVYGLRCLGGVHNRVSCSGRCLMPGHTIRGARTGGQDSRGGAEQSLISGRLPLSRYLFDETADAP